MKKYILAPICSAFVVPGLGQILNGQMKKALILLSIVFLLLVGIILDLILSLSGDGVEKMASEDFPALYALIMVFAIVWLYSVLDAFWVGVKTEGRPSGQK